MSTTGTEVNAPTFEASVIGMVRDSSCALTSATGFSSRPSSRRWQYVSASGHAEDLIVAHELRHVRKIHLQKFAGRTHCAADRRMAGHRAELVQVEAIRYPGQEVGSRRDLARPFLAVG